MLNTAPRAFTQKDVADYIRQFDQRTRLLLGIFEMGTRSHVGFVRIDLEANGDALVNAIIGEVPIATRRDHRRLRAAVGFHRPIGVSG